MPKTKLKKSSEKSGGGIVFPATFLALIFLAAVVEIPTHFVERLAGSYLNWRNADREAWGTMWEQESVSREATRQLEEESADAARLKRQAELVENLADLVALIPDGGGIPLTPAKLVELYRKIPEPMQNWLFPPAEMTQYYLNSRWTRSAVWRKNGVGTVYLIDDRNRIIADFLIENEFLAAVDDYGKRMPEGLSSLPRFSGRVYPVEKFYSQYFKLSQPEQMELIGSEGLLVSLPPDLKQVGFAPARQADGYGRIGFESQTREGTVVTIFPAPGAAIDKFLWQMAWGSDVGDPSLPQDDQPAEPNENRPFKGGM